MTSLQKAEITLMRHEGSGYSKIAQKLGVSENTVKSYCKRNNLGGVGKALDCSAGQLCRNCGKMVTKITGHKKRKFCSDACRVAWWNTHTELVNRKAVYHFVCACCGEGFKSYGNKGRKYCSRSCYSAGRFGKGGAV